ncbi:hypothetical protein NM688_g2029 [Phlebia brevispora]|uniref:Uncharacterized protein n=1 Tax=Phlebia brevispora TaxID=194682 RepID=A0ACC1T9N9_9APHY|nr:hypothetical protein NM688_g2029 [Phlebia brevispora]
MPAAVDLSFERFLKRPPPSPAGKEASKPEIPRHQLMPKADDEDSEVDELRDVPLLASYSDKLPLNKQVPRGSLVIERAIDEDYDSMDVSSDTEPVPHTPISPTSDGESLSVPSTMDEADGEEDDLRMEIDNVDYDSASSEDQPSAPSASTLYIQEQPSIATIEDEERPLDGGGSSSSPRATYPSTSPLQRPKYRSYRDQHSLVPMPCLIDACMHTSWMPKEREKHMDTHFHKRWQCGNCKKWYSTSYTLKRHSDSTHVPEACKGAYEAGKFTSVQPYWTMPEFIHRVRMPEETDYLYPVLSRVIKEREELLAKGLLNKRPLPDDILSATGVQKKRTKKPRPESKVQAVPPEPSTEQSFVFASPTSERSPTPAPVSLADASGTSPHLAEAEPEPQASLPTTGPTLDTGEPGDMQNAESDKESIRTVTENHASSDSERISARDLCLQHWMIEHPTGSMDEFNEYWEEASSDEKQAYELLSKIRVRAIIITADWWLIETLYRKLAGLD